MMQKKALVQEVDLQTDLSLRYTLKGVHRCCLARFSSDLVQEGLWQLRFLAVFTKEAVKKRLGGEERYCVGGRSMISS